MYKIYCLLYSKPIQEAINTIKMGFAMVQIIMDVRERIKFHQMNMRIGIHTVFL